jgi:hypothetical protein
MERLSICPDEGTLKAGVLPAFERSFSFCLVWSSCALRGADRVAARGTPAEQSPQGRRFSDKDVVSLQLTFNSW